MNSIRIVIPSRKRADTLARRTLPLFPDAWVTVDESEMDDYARVVPPAQLVPHPPLQSLAEIYNWIVANGHTFGTSSGACDHSQLNAFEDEIVVCVDDDITRCLSFVGNAVRVYRDPAAIRQIIENCAECAKGVGARLFGFTDSANPKNFKPQDPLTFISNPYTVCGYVGKHVQSDPRRRLFRDLDTALTELQDNRIVFCDTRFHFDSIAPLRQSGGNAVNRARDDLKEANRFMARKWGHYVKIGRNGDTVINTGAIKRRQAKV